QPSKRLTALPSVRWNYCSSRILSAVGLVCFNGASELLQSYGGIDPHISIRSYLRRTRELPGLALLYQAFPEDLEFLGLQRSHLPWRQCHRLHTKIRQSRA